MNEEELWNLFDDIKKEEHIDNGINNTDVIKCYCGCEDFIKEDNMNICTKCSSIVSNVIESGAEWRFYGNDDNRDGDPSRCGMPTNNLLPKSSIGSMISCGYKDNIDIRRIRMFQMWNSMPYDERTLWNVFDKMTANTINNGIPQKVIDNARYYIKKHQKKKYHVETIRMDLLHHVFITHVY